MRQPHPAPHRSVTHHYRNLLRRKAPLSGVLLSGFALACSDDGGVSLTPGIQDSFGFAPTATTDASPSAPAQPQALAFWGELVDNPARPMVAGTLTVTPDGTYAVASDSERDVVYVVDLATRKPSRLGLEPGDQPGRVVSGRNADSTPHAYAVLRRANAIVDINLSSGQLERVPTCKAPRGIAYDAAEELAHVACASGELISYDVDDWSEQRRVFVAPDLRDVDVAGRKLVLSRYTSAEVLIVNQAGEIESRSTPQALPACAASTVAHRLMVRGEDVYLAHQLSNTELIPASTSAPCAVSQVTSMLTREPLEQFTSSAPTWQPLDLILPRDGVKLALDDNGAPFAAGWGWSTGPLDFAAGESGRIVVSLAGNYWVDDLATIVTLDPEVEDDSGWAKTVHQFRPAGMVSGVALDNAGKWLALSREPAALYFEDQPPLFLGGASVDNTGFSLLHMNAGFGISCVSCHPEGGQDGRVWPASHGARLTLPLVGARAPYNWDHSESDMATLLTRVLYDQMDYAFGVTGDQANWLQTWLHSLPVDDTALGGGDAAERGRLVFDSAEAGCADCHKGTSYTDYAVHDVGTASVLATPSLLGLGARTNFLHDGCAATLEDVFGTCGGEHQSVQNLKSEQVEDLLAFLTSL